MEIFRTPDHCFFHLKDYPFAPQFTEIKTKEGQVIRIHHVDEGPPSAPIVLCLHGQPSWSYLYRKMIPVLANAGLRVIAPDLPGYGKSDKPAALCDYTYQRQVDWMGKWLEKNQLTGVTLFGQDWGGLIGLRLVVNYPHRFERVVAANTGLPYNPEVDLHVVERVANFRANPKRLSVQEMARALRENVGPEAFAYWQKFCWETEDMPAGFIMSMMIERTLGCRSMVPLMMHRYFGASLRPPSELGRAYEAPFPEKKYKMGVRAMPSQVPMLPTDPALEEQRKAWEFFKRFEKPFLCLFTSDDPVTRGLEKSFIERIPGTKGMPHQVFENGGHFLQEHNYKVLSQAIDNLIKNT